MIAKLYRLLRFLGVMRYHHRIVQALGFHHGYEIVAYTRLYRWQRPKPLTIITCDMGEEWLYVRPYFPAFKSKETWLVVDGTPR